MHLGNKANEFEAKLNFKTANPNKKITKDLLQVEELTKEEAFLKGVDYLMEVILVYGIIGIMSILEIRKAIRNSKQANEKIKGH